MRFTTSFISLLGLLEATSSLAQCSGGIDGIEKSGVCCAAGCVSCGGSGCSTLSYPLTAADCCTGSIVGSGTLCSEPPYEAPCVVDETLVDADAMMCSTVYGGVANDNVCCAAGCGSCGGTGCSSRGLPDLDAYDCCTGPIMAANDLCEDVKSAPCVLEATTACPTGTNVCKDPHLQGLLGQHFEWHGADGGWYCLVKDDDVGLQVNVRPTSPLPVDFPERQYITGISVMSNGHSVVIEVKDPYSVKTQGCKQLDGDAPCLADGGLRTAVDGHEVHDILGSTRNEYVTEGITVSASNLPVECREFGGTKLWASMLRENIVSKRELDVESFEDWVLNFDHMVAPKYCQKYVAEHGLDHVDSKQSLFRVTTPTAVVRFGAGVNHRPGGKMDRLGRTLPELDFWQTGAGVEGLSLEHEQLTGLLGETAHPRFDEDGHVVMEGLGSIRGTIEDYRVSDALGTDFAFLHV